MTAPVTVLAAVLALVAAVVPASAQTDSCPVETEGARRIALRFSTGEPYAAVREQTGIHDGFQLRLLAEAADEPTCRRLWEVVQTVKTQATSRTGRLIPTFYAAGDHYLISFTREPLPLDPPPGHAVIRLGFTPLLVLDQEMNVLASLAM